MFDIFDNQIVFPPWAGGKQSSKYLTSTVSFATLFVFVFAKFLTVIMFPSVLGKGNSRNCKTFHSIVCV